MPKPLCKALTKHSVRPCKHRALIQSEYCACHASMAAGSANSGENVFECLPQDILFQHILQKHLNIEDLAVLACTSKSMVQLLEKPMRCLHKPIELLKALLLRDAHILLELVRSHDFKAHASIHYRSPPGAPGLTISLIADIHKPAIYFHIYSYLHQCMSSSEMWTGTASDTERCMNAIDKHAVIPRELQRLRERSHVFAVDPALRLYCNRELAHPDPSPLTESDYLKLESLRYPKTYGRKIWIWPIRPDVYPFSSTLPTSLF